MPRYFFDFGHGTQYSKDVEGIDFPDTEQAYLQAFEAAREMWSDLLQQRRDPHRCFFEVRDEQRELLFTLPFQEVVESCLDRQVTPLHRTFAQANFTFHHARRVGAEVIEQIRITQETLKELRALLAQKI